MSQNRLKGIDCRIAFAGPDGGEDSLQKFKSFEIVFDGEIILEDYVGEVTPDPDDVSNGIKIKAEVHLNDPAIFDFIQRVENRRRRIAGAGPGKFSIVGRFEFPDGQVRKVLVPDVYFGAFPISVRGRKDYVGTSIDGAAKNGKVIK